jgi:hypothetical protein
MNGNWVAGDGPRELPPIGCVFFLMVSKSGAFPGPLTVADVIFVFVGKVPNALRRSGLGSLEEFATGCFDLYPGVVGSADSSAGSGLASGGVDLNSDNKES